jgi:hypothetical protein
VRELRDHDGALAALHADLGDRGVTSLDDALDDLRFAAVHGRLDGVVADLLADRDPAASWRGWVADLSTPATPAPAAPAPGTAARAVATVGATAASVAAVVHAAAHLPDARGTWRRTRERSMASSSS